MFNAMKITVLSFFMFVFVSNAFAQKAADIVGTWKMDYEASKALMSAEDKAGLTEETEKMLKPMMGDMRFVYDKSGKYEFYIKNDKMTSDDAKWQLKGKILSLINLKNGDKDLEVIEASKKRIVLYDKGENGGFKKTVLVPAK